MKKIKKIFIQNFEILTTMPTTWDFIKNKKNENFERKKMHSKQSTET